MDKIQLIKQEIERLKTQNELYLDKEYAESTKWYKHGAYDICFQLLNFIDSIPEENNIKIWHDSSEIPTERKKYLKKIKNQAELFND